MLKPPAEKETTKYHFFFKPTAKPTGKPGSQNQTMQEAQAVNNVGSLLEGVDEESMFGDF